MIVSSLVACWRESLDRRWTLAGGPSKQIDLLPPAGRRGDAYARRKSVSPWWPTGRWCRFDRLRCSLGVRLSAAISPHELAAEEESRTQQRHWRVWSLALCLNRLRCIDCRRRRFSRPICSTVRSRRGPGQIHVSMARPLGCLFHVHGVGRSAGAAVDLQSMLLWRCEELR